MAIVDIKTYFKDRMVALKYTEFKEPFHDGNIPSTLIDNAFTVILGSASGETLSNKDLEITTEVQLSVFIKAYADVYSYYDLCVSRAEAIIKDLLTQTNQATYCINGIVFNNFVIEAFSNELNDNILVVNFSFNVRTFIKL